MDCNNFVDYGTPNCRVPCGSSTRKAETASLGWTSSCLWLSEVERKLQDLEVVLWRPYTNELGREATHPPPNISESRLATCKFHFGLAPLQKIVRDFCCIEFGGFCRGFPWMTFSGHLSPTKIGRKTSATSIGAQKVWQ